ncbi:hypothetical protein Hanom_Chr04g00310251 [Helianthus anomalus]
MHLFLRFILRLLNHKAEDVVAVTCSGGAERHPSLSLYSCVPATDATCGIVRKVGFKNQGTTHRFPKTTIQLILHYVQPLLHRNVEN